MSMSGLTKSSAIQMNPLVKAGQGWDYDDPYLTYDGATDIEGRDVLYDSIGSAITMSGLTKSSSVTLTPLTKNIA